tara:strand:+ start:299 stop:409 length:111 start_codon:yes stop_codon:yes gene_type:complete
MRTLIYFGLAALMLGAGFSFERERVRVIMELQNDFR